MSKKEGLKAKRNIIFVALAGVVVLVGATIAYHTASGTFKNFFGLGHWENQTTEEFVSPSDWKPCDNTEKTIVGKNTGNIRAAVRFKYDESWVASDGTTSLALVDGNNVRLAIVNLQNQTDWEDGQDGWFYYKQPLDPGETTSSLLASVTFNCDANFTGANNVCSTVNGVTSCTKPANSYDGASYHMLATMQYIEEPYAYDTWGHAPAHRDPADRSLYNAIVAQVNDLQGYQIDFTRRADSSGETVSDRNGYGVNTATEKNQTVYYYRGDDALKNYVIWGNKCWRIVRTTYTGGIKLAYYGTPYEGTFGPNPEDTREYCPAYMSTSSSTFANSSLNMSPASTGYMYGIAPLATYSLSTSYYYDADGNYGSGSYLYFGDVATLDPGTTDSYSFPNNLWYYSKDYASRNYKTGYNYSCYSYNSYVNNAKKCVDGNGKEFPVYYRPYTLSSATSSGHMPITGNLENTKRLMVENNNESMLKINLEAWYESAGFNGAIGETPYESYLEDAIFCNDRTIETGALSAETVPVENTNYYAAYQRNMVVTDGNLHPTYDCSNTNDSFTRKSANGNGKLKYSIGSLTADEVTYAGGSPNYSGFLNNQSGCYWTMSPANFGNSGGSENFAICGSSYYRMNVTSSQPMRPSVSLRHTVEFSRGVGSYTDPYVIK